MPRVTPTEEVELVQQLYALGSGKSESEIRELLEKHNWNPDAAAGALFDTSSQPEEQSFPSQPEQTGHGWSQDGSWPTLQGDDATSSWAAAELEYPPERGRSMERGRLTGALNASSNSLC
jgi:hypothetical protein